MAKKFILTLPVLLLFIAIAFSCIRHKTDGKVISDLTKAESLLDSLPDSTLSIIHDIEVNEITEDSLLAKIFYLSGRARLKLWDYSGAITPLLYAEKSYETAHDHRLTAMTRERIMELYDSIDNDRAMATYAIKASQSYNECNDTVRQIELLAKTIFPLVGINDINRLDSVADIMKKLSVNVSDSTLLCHVDRAGIWAQILSDMLIKERHSDFYYDTDGLRDSLFSEGSWEKFFSDDYKYAIHPDKVHTLCDNLRAENMFRQAKELTSKYLDKYTTPRYGEVIITNPRTFGHEAPYALPLTRESFLREYIPDVERAAVDFYYNETVIKEQTIRHQRDMMTAIAISCGLLICIMVMAIWIIRARKNRIAEENMRSAMELRIALNKSKDQWLKILVHLCDTYYKAYANESTRSKIAREALNEINTATESPDFFRQLEDKLNSEYDNLYDKLRAELCKLHKYEYRIFTLNALGFSIPTIAMLLKEKREVIYNRRVRLRAKIQQLAPPHAELFMHALE